MRPKMDRLDVLIERLTSLLWYVQDKVDIRNRMVAEGYTDEEIYLCYLAAVRINKREEERVKSTVAFLKDEGDEDNVYYETGCLHPDATAEGRCTLCGNKLGKMQLDMVREHKSYTLGLDSDSQVV